MTTEELRQLCDDVIERGGDALLLDVPLARPPRGETIRLCGTEGPRGEVINYRESGQCVARFSAKAVKRWLKQRSA